MSLLDVREELYGQTLRVEFVERLRGDQVFSSAEELSACIERDVQRAREALKAEPQPVTGSR